MQPPLLPDLELLEPPPLLVELLEPLLVELPVPPLEPLPDPAALLLLLAPPLPDAGVLVPLELPPLLLPEAPAVEADPPLLLALREEAVPPDDADAAWSLLPVWDALPEEPVSWVPCAHSPLVQV